jgi:hypothetical protein
MRTIARILKPLALALLLPASVQAQLVVSDPPVESATTAMQQSLADIDQIVLPNILTQDTATATSVTTGGGGGLFNPISATLNTWTSNLDQGVNDPGTFATNFPGWYALPPNAAQVAATTSQLALNTYAGAIAVCNAQEQNFANEDAQLGQIEADSSQATALLQAVQALTESVLVLNQQVQMLRQLEATCTTVEAVRAGEELNERAAAGATTEMSYLLGVPGQ